MAGTKPGPLAILDVDQNVELFFDSLEAANGNVSAACRAVGITWDHVRRASINDAAFARRLESTKATVRKLRAEAILESVDDQILKTLQMNMIPLTDEHGAPVLDEDLEQVMVPGSLISVKGLVDIRKDARQSVEGESPLVALQVNNAGNDHEKNAPQLTISDPRSIDELLRLYGSQEVTEDATDVLDAEFEEVLEWDD